MGLLFLLSCASEYISFSFESFLKFSLSIFEFCEWNFRQLLCTQNKWQAALGGSGAKALMSCTWVVSSGGVILRGENCWRLPFLLILMKVCFTYFPTFWQFFLQSHTTANTNSEKQIKSYRWYTKILPHLGAWLSYSSVVVRDCFHLSKIQLCDSVFIISGIHFFLHLGSKRREP